MNMYRLQKTDDQINAVLNRCAEQEDKGGSAFPGMTYEQGIKEAIEWMISDNNDSLFE